MRAPRTRRGLPSAPALDSDPSSLAEPLPPPVPLPGEEGPFLRPRRPVRVRRVRRGSAQRLVLWVQAGALSMVALMGAWLFYRRVLHSDGLRVRHVEVHGNRFLSEGEVRELLGPADGANILGLDIEDLTRRLRASPWLDDATVRRNLPDTLQVEVRERAPLALAEVDRLYLMDAQGDLIDLYGSRTATWDLPIVRGLRGLADEERRERARRAALLIEDLGELEAEVSEIESLPSGDLRVVLRGGEHLLVGAPPYAAAFTTFLAMRRDLAERCPDAEAFDLRFRGRIYARQPVAASATTLAASGGGTGAVQ